MSQLRSNTSSYQVGGALAKDFPAYVTRAADAQLYEALANREFCYVLNSRQMGKSSLMIRVLERLRAEGWAGTVLDFSAKDSQEKEKPDRWYNGIISKINQSFGLHDDIRGWLRENSQISPVERLEEYISTILLPGLEQNIVIFIDEIDSTLNLPFADDFFALIRSFYNKRADNPAYIRLTFAMLGVASPAELIADSSRTPFNIGQAIDLRGFELEEAQPLASGLTEIAASTSKVLQEILKWTGGQPFLTQRVCKILAEAKDFIPEGAETAAIERVVRNKIIDNWEANDEQVHLKTIRDRVFASQDKAGQLLELYRQVLQVGNLKSRNTPEERSLQLTGLVVKRNSCLSVYNPIYQQIFNQKWIERELSQLRPYAASLAAWVASGKSDTSRLLRGEALVEALRWSEGKTLSGEDQDYVSASQNQERDEQFEARERAAELERERKDKEAAQLSQLRLEEANQQAEKTIQHAKQELKRSRRTSFIILAFASLGLILASCIGLNFVRRGQDAEQKGKLATQQAEKSTKQATTQTENARREAEKAKREKTDATKEKNNALTTLKRAQDDKKKAQDDKSKAQDDKRKAQVDEAKAKQSLQRARSHAGSITTMTENVKATYRLTSENEDLKMIDERNDSFVKAARALSIGDKNLQDGWLKAVQAELYLDFTLNMLMLDDEDVKGDKLQAQQFLGRGRKLIEESIASLNAYSGRKDGSGNLQHVRPMIYLTAARYGISVDSQKLSLAYEDFAQSSGLRNSGLHNQSLKASWLSPDNVYLLYSLQANRDQLRGDVVKYIKNYDTKRYERLSDFLRQQKFHSADTLTDDLMSDEILRTTIFNPDGEVNEKAMNTHYGHMRCIVIAIADDLWRSNTHNKFGFSVQNMLYQEAGDNVEKFVALLGWRKLNPEQRGLAGLITPRKEEKPGNVEAYAQGAFPLMANVGFQAADKMDEKPDVFDKDTYDTISTMQSEIRSCLSPPIDAGKSK